MTDLRIVNSFYISSEDRRTGDTNANFEIALLNQESGIQKFSVEYVKITKSWYPVILGENSRLDFNDGVGNFFIVLSSGSYTASEFITALNAAIVAALPTNLITFSTLGPANQGKIQAVIAGGATMTLFFSDANPDSMRDLLGFKAHVDIVSVGPVISDSVADFNDGITFIDVTSKRLNKYTTQANTTGQNRAYLIARIPVNIGGFGSTITYQPTILKMFDFDPNETLGRIDIKLIKPNGNILDLNGTRFDLALTFYK